MYSDMELPRSARNWERSWHQLQNPGKASLLLRQLAHSKHQVAA